MLPVMAQTLTPPELSSDYARAPIRLRLLGDFDLRVHDEPRSALLAYDKPRLLLAVLGLARGEPVSRTRIAELLWPELAESEGKARARHALHLLRKTLADVPGALLVSRADVALSAAHVHVDALAIVEDDLADAMRLTLYRGPLLDGFDTAAGSSFAAWRRHWDERVASELAQARGRLASALRAPAERAALLRHVQRWVTLWPDDEDCHRLLVQLLLEHGQRDAAARAHARYEAALGPQARLPEANAPPPPAPVRPDAAAIRPLAALAVNLAWLSGDDDTEVAAHLDAYAALRRRLLDLALAHQGWIVQQGPDTFVAYFGFPDVDERPATQAARLARAIAALEFDGPMFVGQGLHAHLERDVADDRPDRDARLAQVALSLAWRARPGQIRVSPGAAARLRPDDTRPARTGEATDLVLEPVAPPRGAGAPRLHGRTREIARLIELWRGLSGAATPQFAVLTGAPGCGKSLLAHTLARYAGEHDAQVARIDCRGAAAAGAHRPWQAWLSGLAASAGGGATAPSSAERLERHLRHRLGMPDVTARTLARIGAGSHPPGPAQRDAWHEALCDLFARLAQDGLLLVVEHLDDADEATQALLMRFAGRHCTRPALILATSRQPLAEFASRLPPRLALPLGPLADEAIADLIGPGARQARIPRAQREAIVARSQGNPRFALAMLRAAIAREPVHAPGRIVDEVCALLASVDARAQELARLYALWDAPLSAERAASLLRQPVADVVVAIDQLAARHLLAAEADAAWRCPPLYASSLRQAMSADARRRLALAVAERLIQTSQDDAAIAALLELALDARAPRQWLRVAQAQLTRGQTRAAADPLARALRLAAWIEDAEARAHFDFECHLLQGALATLLTGPSGEAAAAAFGAASTLCPPGELPQLMSALWGRWMVSHHQGEHAQAHDLAREIAQVAQALQDREAQGWAAYAMAQHYLWRGQGLEAEQLLRYAQMSIQVVPRASAAPFGSQGDAILPASLAVALALQGRHDEALRAAATALAQARQGNAPVMVKLCLLAAARVHYLNDDVAQAAATVEPLMTPSAADFQPWHALASGYVLLPRLLAGDARARADMEHALVAIRAGNPVSIDGHLCLLARGLIAQRDLAGASRHLDDAWALGLRHDSHSLRPEILCLRGDVAYAAGHVAEAAQAWREARQLAQGAGPAAYLRWADERLDALADQGYAPPRPA